MGQHDRLLQALQAKLDTQRPISVPAVQLYIDWNSDGVWDHAGSFHSALAAAQYLTRSNLSMYPTRVTKGAAPCRKVLPVT